MSQTIKGSSNAPFVYRDTNLTSVAVGAAITPVELAGYTITNNNNTDAYVKCYDTSSGNTTVGTTTVVKTIHVPSNTTIVIEPRKHDSLQYFATALTIAAVTGIADSSTTAPSTGLYVEIYYFKTN